MRLVASHLRRLALFTLSISSPVYWKQGQWRQQARRITTYRRLPNFGSPAIEVVHEGSLEAEGAVHREEGVVIGRLDERNGGDKRVRNEQNQRSAKRRRVNGEEELPVYATKFSAEEIAAQERKPKRKVAVMIGYSGSGYKGMQLNHQEKTIEGDLFAAFVAAGAISKANADDPKKSSLVRCARTDKGVHAAGNLISLKLVIEESEIVRMINAQLNPQIRVWGIVRTNNSFSAYQMCDSRVYEYLIPSYCFLPPHPQSFLGKQIVELAKEEGDLEGYKQRQDDVLDFWTDMEEKFVKPVLEGLDPVIRDEALQIFYSHENARSGKAPKPTEADRSQTTEDDPLVLVDQAHLSAPQDLKNGKVSPPSPTATRTCTHGQSEVASKNESVSEQKQRVLSPTGLALRSLKSAHTAAKRAHRISPARLARIKSTLSRFIGSHRFHNYTIDKSSKDPSAIRVIKSFTVSENPIMIGGTEWLSIKVHGQSFMMHQIRKMISAAALVVRCGCHEGRIEDTYLSDRFSIPKAPSLGLLLERPVFDAYNDKLVELGRERIDFGKYEKEIAEFKQREIYERIFREEEKDGVFLAFFAALDSTRSPGLLWASSKGIEASRQDVAKAGIAGGAGNINEVSSEDEHGGQDES
ncbi:MAG: hypothetical protein Q9163_002632 [Psora crenata]